MSRAPRPPRPPRPLRHRAAGAALVEFAMVLSLFVLLLFGMIEFGRALFTWNSAVDATRRGARTASIVAVGNSAPVITSMRQSLPDLQDRQVHIEYSTDGVNFAPAGGCVRGTCAFVRVRIDAVFRPAVPFLVPDFAMPDFATTVPVEALGAT